MGYDAKANRASAARDIAGAGKKKRANRTARLKQCKLDARREQWLSQVKSKDCKAADTALSPTSRLLSQSLSLPCGRKMCVEKEETPLHDGSDSESPMQSPCSSGGSGYAPRKGGPGNSIGSSCSVGSSSRTVSDTELEDGEDGNRGGEPLDDWEMVADALTADNDRGGHNLDSKPDAARNVVKESLDRALGKPEPIRPPPRAWRPDDAARPRSLPRLSKQRSFLASMDPQCGFSNPEVLSSPCTCPICCEVLDVTDSSFLPCSCGFRLCLFCHKRILEEDGRCPGCRKQYSATMGKAIDVEGR